MQSSERERPSIPWAAIPLFQCLKPAERESLRPLVRLKSYDEGAVIFREGDPALMFHFVLGGRVKIIKAAAAGRDIILEIFGPGDPVGAVAAYEERDFPATAVALESTSLLSIPRQELFALLVANPMLARGLLLGLTRRMVEMTRKLAERSSRVEYRVARLFLTLADRVGRRDGEALFIPVALSRQEIADMVGTTQETAIRIMSRWGKDGLIVTGESGFRIPNRSRLEEIPPGD
ncbi:MAG TPA: Crp/Fnr family transcriptional regulator [Candidatus Polarisedimenticolia bacterium]|nr:Crp/Fnr family transcriptional regulator [Candidatus Polarisedimenticolia bacterium]